MATLADILRQTGYSQDGTLAAPTPVEPTMTSILQKHIANLPQTTAQNLANQRQDIDAALQMTPQGIQVGDQQAFNNVMSEVPNIAALTAWHGTPHKIQGAFDINKVGTGEGAQAYGHGMYFAENPNVARSYATTGSYETPADYASHFLAESKHDPKAAIQMLKNEAALYDKKGWDKADIPKDMIPKIEEALKKGEARSNLYKVDIPDEHIPNMLDWDKPLASQNKQVLDGLKKLNDPYINKAIATQPKLSKDGEYWEYMGNTYGSKSEALEDATPQRIISGYTNIGKTPEEVSKALNNIGIKGISYLDQGSRIEGQGSRNFVVFDPSTVKILEENGKPVSRKALIEEQVKKLKD